MFQGGVATSIDRLRAEPSRALALRGKHRDVGRRCPPTATTSSVSGKLDRPTAVQALTSSRPRCNDNVSATSRNRREATRRAVASPIAPTRNVVPYLKYTSLSDAEVMSVLDYDGRINEAIPSIAGIYAVYDAAMRIQYVGTSQSVVSSVQSHVRDFPDDVTTFVKVREMQTACSTSLHAAWLKWLQQAGSVPMGNADPRSRWQMLSSSKPMSPTPTEQPMYYVPSPAEVDPALALSAQAQSLVTAEALARLASEGFVVIENALTPDLARAVCAEADSWRQKGFLQEVSHQTIYRRDQIVNFSTDSTGLVCGAEELVVLSNTTEEHDPKEGGANLLDIQRQPNIAEAAKILMGVPHAIQHQQERRKGSSDAWRAPPLALPRSLMMACYPGNGTAYVRHLDNDKSHANEGTMQGVPGTRVGDREVTAILYFNDEWRADRDGGSLRVFHPYTPVGMAERYTDISPSAGRLVLFQSNLVAHEVLPAHRPRWALTAWIPQMQAFQDHQGYISLP